MKKDPIVEEIHGIREDLSKEAGDDLQRIAEAAKERQGASKDHPVVTLPPKRIPPTRKAS